MVLVVKSVIVLVEVVSLEVIAVVESVMIEVVALEVMAVVESVMIVVAVVVLDVEGTGNERDEG